MSKKILWGLFALTFCAALLMIPAMANNDGASSTTPTLSKVQGHTPVLQDSLFYVTDHSVYFADVLKKHAWAINEIDYLANTKTISGTGSCLYSPDATIRRADFLIMLYRAYDMSRYVTNENFADVPADAYYADALSACRVLGIATGDENDNFYPTQSLTRQDAMLFLYRTLARTGLILPTGDLSTFSDADQIADHAIDAVSALVRAGVISGTDGRISPNGEISRASMAVMLYRALMLTVENGEARFVDQENVMNICIGSSFYPNVTIRNLPENGLNFGLYELRSLYETDNGHELVMGAPASFNDRISFQGNSLKVNGETICTASGYEAIAVDVYGMLDGLYATGKQYSGAATVVQDGALATIYYKK